MITKAIIPVAGIGSRFLPASKSIPKEMFPVLDRPVIHYIVKEAVDSGIKDIIFVTSTAKRAVEDYFDANFELEYRLDKKGKAELKSTVREMVDWANFYFIRQPEPKGDGDAILRARHCLSADEPCVVMWGDDVIVDRQPTLSQIMKAYDKYQAPIFAVEEIAGQAIERYGVIDAREVEPNIYQVAHIVEKPKLQDAPSNLGIVGRYIITKEVWQALSSQEPAEDGEIRFSHALRDAINHTKIYAYKFSGTRYDCGNKLGWLKANIALALTDAQVSGDLRDWINSLLV